ncbi:folate-binding protein [Sneathiella sp. P13V-1]|uniref:CAF17-like 4Fe-4S cluster assembly/insertion protein YgfZ n=1 Tax=Sneathiella sp. P13V-1 TaxID=2697366 RepID=UPI00187B40AA|nr:folate-binding protein YgfZ [Sneathiella sp. P13V-1]MBE7638546.1 folate-binding protein [Sneathiella sp. P13V-1]
MVLLKSGAMTEVTYAKLDDRSLLKISGDDRTDFLQNLISNDLGQLSADKAIYSALLTPQGKFLFDFFLMDFGDYLLLDCEKSRSADLIKRLTMYKLRSAVEIEDISDALSVFGIFDKNPGSDITPPDNLDGKLVADPRLSALGYRLYTSGSSIDHLEEADEGAYRHHRFALGVPEGSEDIQPEKNFLLEANFEELNGVSFSKGCYIGQELTARTKFRAKIKKRLFKFEYDGDLSAGDLISSNEKEIAKVVSFSKPYGLAMTRLDAFGSLSPTPELSPAGLRLTKPDYVILSEKED